jgi:hypothetical protein
LKFSAWLSARGSLSKFSDPVRDKATQANSFPRPLHIPSLSVEYCSMQKIIKQCI